VMDAGFAAYGSKACIHHTTPANCCRVPSNPAWGAGNESTCSEESRREETRRDTKKVIAIEKNVDGY
jgi:hypothetical protein